MNKDYTLGRGKVYFDPFAPGTTTPTGELYFGSTMSFGLSVAAEELKHMSMEEGIAVKDASVTTQIDYTAQFVTDNASIKNLAYFFMGTTSTLTQGAETDEEEDIEVLQDRYYQLGRTAALPSGKRNVSNVVVQSGAGPTTHVLGTDYTLEADLGRIYIVPGGGIANGTEITVTYDVAASTREQTVSAGTPIRGALRFVAFNPEGTQKDYFMASVEIRPNGELALKGTDWQQFGFTVDINALGAVPNVIVDGRAFP